MLPAQHSWNPPLTWQIKFDIKKWVASLGVNYKKLDGENDFGEIDETSSGGKVGLEKSFGNNLNQSIKFEVGASKIDTNLYLTNSEFNRTNLSAGFWYQVNLNR